MEISEWAATGRRLHFTSLPLPLITSAAALTQVPKQKNQCLLLNTKILWK